MELAQVSPNSNFSILEGDLTAQIALMEDKNIQDYYIKTLLRNSRKFQ